MCFLSLSLSLYIYIYIYIYIYSFRIHFFTNSLSLSLSHSLTLSHTHTHIFFFLHSTPLFVYFTHPLSLAHTHSPTHTFSFYFSIIFPLLYRFSILRSCGTVYALRTVVLVGAFAILRLVCLDRSKKVWWVIHYSLSFRMDIITSRPTNDFLNINWRGSEKKEAKNFHLISGYLSISQTLQSSILLILSLIIRPTSLFSTIFS